jgi:hypothetical protein
MGQIKAEKTSHGLHGWDGSEKRSEQTDEKSKSR